MSDKCSGYGIMEGKCKNDYTIHAPYYCLGCYEHFHSGLKIQSLKEQLKREVGISNKIEGNLKSIYLTSDTRSKRSIIADLEKILLETHKMRGKDE